MKETCAYNCHPDKYIERGLWKAQVLIHSGWTADRKRKVPIYPDKYYVFCVPPVSLYLYGQRERERERCVQVCNEIERDDGEGPMWPFLCSLFLSYSFRSLRGHNRRRDRG